MSAASCVFRLEVQVLGKGHAPPYTKQNYELVFVRSDEKWFVSSCTTLLFNGLRHFRIVKVAHDKSGNYGLALEAPPSAAGFTYRTYQRTDSNNIEYRDAVSWASDVYLSVKLNSPAAIYISIYSKTIP